LAAREDARRKIEAAPPEMDRARLAAEPRSEAREHRKHRGDRAAEALGGISVIVARRFVLRERDCVRHFVGNAVEGRRQVMKLEHCDQAPMKRSDAPSVERQLLAAAVADPQHDRVAAQIERQRECAAAASRSRQDAEPAGVGLERDMPAVIDPRRVRDPKLPQHLRRQMQDAQRFMVAIDAEPGPVAHLLRLCILRCGIARAEAMIDAETMLDRIAAAESLSDLEALRVTALGKSGSVTALLKSLGAMDPETRSTEA